MLAVSVSVTRKSAKEASGGLVGLYSTTNAPRGFEALRGIAPSTDRGRYCMAVNSTPASSPTRIPHRACPSQLFSSNELRTSHLPVFRMHKYAIWLGLKMS